MFLNHEFVPQDLDEYIIFQGLSPIDNNRFFYRFYYKKKSYVALCDINNRSSKFIKMDEQLKFGITNNVDGGYPFQFTQNAYGNNAYQAISPYQLISLQDKGAFQDADTEFLSLINRLDEGDNPVIAIYHLK